LLCFERALCDAAALGSRFNAFIVAADRFADGALFLPALAVSCSAFRRVAADAPFFGGGRSTPARRAFDSPIAMACFDERAPCFPSRMWSISSRTNSPAGVEGDFPSRWSSFARSKVLFSGIVHLSPEPMQSTGQKKTATEAAG
jgi:hypothetical protein